MYVCFFYKLVFVFQTGHHFDAVSSKRANFDDVQFYKHIGLPNNLQTFKHNTVITQ